MAILPPEELTKRLTRALKIGGDLHSPKDIVQAVKEGRMQSFEKGQSVIVTEMLGYPNGLIMNLYLCAGNLDEILSLLPEVEKFAKDHGCKRVFMGGRKGWAKFADKLGWKHDKIVLTKDL